MSFDGSNVRFTFSIPLGNDGNQGGTGSQGEPSIPGPPGEFTTALHFRRLFEDEDEKKPEARGLLLA